MMIRYLDPKGLEFGAHLWGFGFRVPGLDLGFGFRFLGLTWDFGYGCSGVRGQA